MSRILPEPGHPTGSTTDDEVVARIAEAVHGPFAAAWRDHQERAWRPVRLILDEVAEAHLSALRDFEAGAGAVSGPRAENAGEELRAEYRRRVAHRVLGPLHGVLRETALAVPLYRSLSAAAGRAGVAVAAFPDRTGAPVAASALDVRAELGAAAVAKRLCARLLRPIVWRRQIHEIAVSSLARLHLQRNVLPRQRRAFRAGQRHRAAWLGRVERAWAEWTVAVLLPPKEGPTGESGEAGAVRACLAAARGLRSELEALRDTVVDASGRMEGEDFGRPSRTLAAKVAVAGTFAATVPTGAPPVHDDEGLAVQWDAWAAESAARLEMHLGLLAVRAAADATLRRLTERWDGTTAAIQDVLDRIENTLEGALHRAGRLPDDPDPMRRSLTAERERTLYGPGPLASGLDNLEPFANAVTEGAERAVEDLEAARLELPDVTVHDLPASGENIRRPGAESRSLPARDHALQAFDTLRMERIRTAPSAVTEALERIRSEVGQLVQVAEYGYQAALDELAEGSADAPARARGLVTDGLSRAGGKVEVARGTLRAGLAAAKARARSDVLEGVEHLVRRVTADRVVAGYLDARTYLVTAAARHWGWLRRRAARGGRRLWAALRGLGGGLRGGLAALGLRTETRRSVESKETTLASATELVRTLPVVYQRLFAFEPVTDPRLLAGRDQALDEVRDRWTRWKAGGPGSLLVVATPGAGVTSFLNIVSQHLADEAPRGVRRIMRERFRDEAGLAARLASWIGLGGAGTLRELAGRMRACPPDSIPPHFVLEGAEHLHLRAPGGGTLFRRFLTLVSQTESRVFWIVSLTSSAWQLLRTREPALATSLRRLTLGPLGPPDLQRAIESRHLRSGLPLEYVAPQAGTGALRIRARRIHKGHRRQELLRKDYFDHLCRASLGSVRLGLFHWLRSADFTTAEGRLLVRPLRPLSPATDLLDPTRSFALKAILDHGTLSAPEFREVLRMSAAECVHTLRSLEEQHFIGTADGGEGTPGADVDRVSGPRYRIRPLMTGAVVAHLRSRNILH